MLAEILLKVGAAGMGADRKYQPSPSLAGPDRCIRQLVYHARNFPAQAWGDRFASVLEDGHWHEELLKDWIRKSAYKLHSEQMPVTFDTGRDIGGQTRKCEVCGKAIGSRDLHGHLDGILTDLLAVDHLLEVKSVDHFKFNRLWEAQEIPLDNLTQVALYLRAAQEDAPELRRFVLAMKNRNTSQLIDHVGYYDRATDTLHVEHSTRSDGQARDVTIAIPGITAAAVSKLESVELYRWNESLPPRPYEFGNEFPCSYCRWQEVCWEGYEAEVAARADHVVLQAENAALAMRIEATGAEIARLEKIRKEAKRELLGSLEVCNARTGEAGGYEVAIKLSKRNGYTVKPTTVQTLDVRRKKEPREGAA